MKRHIWLASVAIIVGLLLIGNKECLACGSWGAITSSSNTDSLPSPISDSDSGWGWQWNYSMGGSNGSFSGYANTTFSWYTMDWDKDTGIQTATGWQQKTMGGWTSGGAGHHGAPNDARVTGQGDGTVVASIHMDANNWSPLTGSCAALAYGKITFSGVASGSVDITLNGTFSEGATTVSGTLSKSPSITITATIDGDVADAQDVNTISLTQQFTGNVAGQVQKGYGTCSVRARCNTSACESTAEASTSITTNSLVLNYGGTGSCVDLCAQHTH